MRRFFTLMLATLALTACGSNSEESVINEQEAMNAAYDLSYDLATKVLEATSYEEFKAARAEIERIEEAFRTEIGGEEYLIFLEESNMMLNEK